MNAQLSINDCEIFADGLDHPEGLAFHPDGSLWAGGEAGQIYRITDQGKTITELGNTGGFILGLAFSPDADWLAICDLKNHCIWKMNPTTAQIQLFAKGVEGHSISIPNYPVFDSYGNLYVSESGAFRQTTGKILKWNSAGQGEIWHSGPFNFSNGMALSPDGNWLYVVCSFLPGIERIKIEADGSAGERELFCMMDEKVPDGIAFDTMGNLYIACYAPNAIYVVSPERKMSTLINDWEAHTVSNPTNIAFGGESMQDLYCTNLGRWHITKMPSNIAGFPLVGQLNKT
ncbi:MAG: SMP-30/gluconolactonase/LRE family protein [Saprospiraceae bacterium]